MPVTACPECGVDDASGLHPCRPQPSLLDTFALAALTGLLATPKLIGRPGAAVGDLSHDDYAATAYAFADAMVRERRRRDAAREGA